MSKSAPPPYAVTEHVRDRCLCLHAQRAARALARRFDAAFRPLGLTSGQFSLLMGLNRPAPPTIGAVAALLAMDRTTLTAALKPLQRRGLVALSSDDRDRRSRRVALTAAGGALLAEAAAIWRAEHDALDRELAATDAAALTDGLRAMAGASRRNPAGASAGDGR